MSNQSGWTLTELLAAIIGLAGIGMFFVCIYVAIHFIAKFW